MIRNTFDKIYVVISKIIDNIENDLDQLKNNTGGSILTIRKNLVDTLAKLTSLLIQLEKIEHRASEPNSKDQEIINQFLESNIKIK